MHARTGCLAVMLAVLSFAGCRNEGPPVERDGGGGGGGGGGGTGTGFRGPVLRKQLGLDLATVSSFAYVPTQRAWRTDALETTGLVALTLSGEVLSVSLVEPPGGGAGGPAGGEPFVDAIYPTPAWLFFGTTGFRVAPAEGTGSADAGADELLECSVVAARRADGALYCAKLGIRHSGDNYGNADPLAATVKSNAAGDVVYVVSADALNRDVLYRLTFDELAGPRATLVSASLHPNWFVVNGTGDLLLNFSPPGAPMGTNVTRLLPRDGGAPVELAGAHNSFAAVGLPGEADADTFYVMSGGSGGVPFDGTLWVVTRSGAAFVETAATVTLVDRNCSWLPRLAGGLYSLCGDGQMKTSLPLLVTDGGVDPNPAVTTLSDVTRTVGIAGSPACAGPGYVAFTAVGSAGAKFVRHDGVSQVDIPLEARLQVLGFSVSCAGVIDFLGVYSDTNEAVRGTVASGSTTVTILSVQGVSLASAVVFSRIN